MHCTARTVLCFPWTSQGKSEAQSPTSPPRVILGSVRSRLACSMQCVRGLGAKDAHVRKCPGPQRPPPRASATGLPVRAECSEILCAGLDDGRLSLELRNNGGF